MRPSLLPESPLTPRASHSVHIAGLGTSVPPLVSAQRETLEFVLSAFDVKESTRALYRRTFAHPSIRQRHFALGELREVLDRDRDRIHKRFEAWAVELSTRSLQRALANAGAAPAQLDYLAVTTCTGYLCPGLSAYLVETCGLRPDVIGADITGMGCGAAVPGLHHARNFIAANPGATAAVVSTEICSATMFSNDAPDIVISNTVFADGSAAAVLRSADPGRGRGPGPRLIDFSSLTVPEWRETLRFTTEDGYLKNVLGKAVPAQSAHALRRVSDSLLSRHGLTVSDARQWIVHAGGGRILEEIERELNLEAEDLSASRRVLREFGNMSSPTVLFVLEEQLRARPPRAGDFGILCSFGAGFSAHAALVEF